MKKKERKSRSYNFTCHCERRQPRGNLAIPRNLTRLLRVARNDGQNGRSMIEMLGILAIIGVLSVGGVSMFQSAMMKYKLHQLQDNINQRHFAVVENCLDDDRCMLSMNAIRKVFCPVLGGDFCIGDYLNSIFPSVMAPTYMWNKENFHIYFYYTTPKICKAIVNYDWANLTKVSEVWDWNEQVVDTKIGHLTQEQKDSFTESYCDGRRVFVLTFKI